MAWEELLKLHEKQEDGLAQASDDEARDKGSLIRQAAAMIGMTETETAVPTEEESEPEEPLRYADGYVRRSPVQVYLTAEDYDRRRIRKAILIAVGAVLALLLVLALAKTGLLRLR